MSPNPTHLLIMDLYLVCTNCFSQPVVQAALTAYNVDTERERTAALCRVTFLLPVMDIVYGTIKTTTPMNT